jgi:hypothetical protein
MTASTTTPFAPRILMVLLLTAGLWVGCRSDAPEPTPEAASARPASTPAQATSDDPAMPDDPAPSLPATTNDDAMTSPAPTAPRLTPDDITPDEPIPAGDLHAAYFAWDDQPVTVGGYLWIFGSMRSSASLDDRIELIAAPGDEQPLLECRMQRVPDQKVGREEPLVVQGTYAGFTTATRDGSSKLRLKDCTLVAVGEAFDADAPAMPGQDEPIPVAALHAAVTGWQGKTVTVAGYYKGSTYSSASDKTRIDLKADRLGDTVVGCRIPGKDVTPPSAVEDREGVTLRGTIGAAAFGQVILEDCTFLNRQ